MTSRHLSGVEKVGPYRLEGCLGRGGMGAVYRGFDERLHRAVALKRLRAAHSARARARFRREARAAARVSHSALVRLYDWIEAENEDWIVMELVEGRSLREIVAEKPLTPDAVARIGRKIAAGLAAAHDAGLVHRDLKSENVMVTCCGEIRILDFGLAKAVESKEDPFSVAERISRSGEIVGTVCAMSPEQALGQPVDHRSDLFSLGSLLYELLTGEPPFRGSTPVETLTRTCTLQPEPLARRVPEAPAELVRIVEGLLEKEPLRRPSSALRVAEDLDAVYLETIGSGAFPTLGTSWSVGRLVDRGDAGTAGDVERPTALHAKETAAVRRRRFGPLAAAAVVLLSAITVLAQQWRLERAVERTDHEAGRADDEAELARELSDFLIGMFESSDPLRAGRGAGDLSARELLDRGAERLRGELTDRPAVHSRLLATIGSAYVGLGDYERGEEVLREGLQVREAALGENSLEVADSLERLRDVLKQGRGRRGELAALDERILAIRERHLGPHHPDVARAALLLGRDYTMATRYDEAAPLLDRALRIYERLGPEHPGVADALYQLAIFNSAQARFDQAVPLLERALAIRERHLGPEHTQLIHMLSNLSIIYQHQRRFAVAERTARRALAICERELGAEHPQTAQMLNNLGRILVASRRYDDAEPVLRRALGLLERQTTSPFYAERTLVALGTVARERGDLARAELHYQRALDLSREWGGGKTDPVNPLRGLAVVRARQGRFGEAEELFQRAFRTQRAKSTEHPKMAELLTDWAELLRLEGRAEELAEAERRIRAIRARHDG